MKIKINPQIKISAKSALRAVFRIAFPYQCLRCGAAVGSEGGFCPDCFKKIKFIGTCCPNCGRPISENEKLWGMCSFCKGKEVPKSRFVFIYDEALKPVILRFKYADMTFAVPYFAKWMINAGKDVLDDADAVVPVPIHRMRLIRRRYNQAALLAKKIAKEEGKEFIYNNLQRVRNTASQGEKSAKERKENVKGAFALSNPLAIAGKKVVIVDDVVTTGATVSECERVLLAAGAAEVRVLSLAVVFKS
jgi:ComF family protein